MGEKRVLLYVQFSCLLPYFIYHVLVESNIWVKLVTLSFPLLLLIYDIFAHGTDYIP